MHTTITSFEDACKALGLDPTVLPEVSMLSEKHRSAILAFYKLTVIAEALNERWQPNWENGKWDKYYPWFDMKGAFSYDGSDHICQFSCVGSRLCFKSADIAEYAGTQFIDLYRDLMVLPQ